MTEALQIRIHGEASLPTLVYLPGSHGDWTVAGSFRRALGRRVRLVEVTYPRTVTWSLDDYAAGVEAALLENGIQRGWLLGESFSSQVVWPLLARKRFQAEGVILVGGFVRHPARWGVRLAERIVGAIPLTWLRGLLSAYAKIARFRFRHSPETMADIREFIARRTEPDRQAIRRRLHLVARSDFRSLAPEIRVPVFVLTGAFDPLVPWIFVRAWMRRHCPALREYKVIWRADHNVLSTAPETSADLVVRWMTSSGPDVPPASGASAAGS